MNTVDYKKVNYIYKKFSALGGVTGSNLTN